MNTADRYFTVFLCVLTFLIVPVKSQEVDTVLFKERLAMPLDELLMIKIITASKTERSSIDITQQYDIVTDQQFDEMVVEKRNIAELLQYLPGASVNVLSRNDANWGAYGGIGPKYSTYMVQGLPIDAFIDPQSLDITAIKRIEIQRGPASILYPNYLSQDFAGNQSPLAGTVNLILKEKVEETKTEVSLGYGAYQTYTAQAYHENRSGPVNIVSGITCEQSDYKDYGTGDSWLHMMDDPRYDRIKIFLGSTFLPGDSEKHKISFFGNHSLQSGDWGRPNRRYNFKYTLFNATYSGELKENLELSMGTGLRRYDRQYENDNYDSGGDLSLQSTSGVEQFIVPVDISLALNHFNNSNLTVGTDFQNAEYRTDERLPDEPKFTTGNDAGVRHFGMYVQEELQLKRLLIRAGGRYNHIRYAIERIGGEKPAEKNKSWNVLLWSAGARFRWTEKLSLFTNTGNSFMSPSLKSIGGTVPLSEKFVPGRNGQLPNPKLEPETGIGIDAGVDAVLPLDIYGTVRAFDTYITDAIIDEVVSDIPSQTRSVNADGRIAAKGFEVGLRQDIWKITWFGNMTYTKSIIENPDDPDQDETEVPFVPEVMGNLGFTLYAPFNTTVSPWAHFGGKIYDSSSKTNRNLYSINELINVVIAKKIRFREHRSLTLFLKVYNLSDNRYTLPWQFQDTGRNISMEIRTVF